MAQVYEKVIQEDLNVGTGTVWITAPQCGDLFSTQIGLHSVARGQKAYDATWAPGAITSGSKASTTVTVPDAAVGDFVMASHDKMLTSELRIAGHVSATNTATVVIHNPTAASVTVASGTVSVLVFPSRSAAATVPVTTSTVTGTVTYDDGSVHTWVGVDVTMTVDGVPWPGGAATTNGSGVYVFLNVPDGAILVSVSDTVGGNPYAGGNNGNTVGPGTLTLDIAASGV